MKFRKLLTIIVGASSVAMGAFGAHILKPVLSEKSMSIFQTASTYHLIYAVMILVLYLYSLRSNCQWLRRSYFCATIGLLFFSGSLYLIAIRELVDLEMFMPIIGPITPVGGVLLIVSWLLLFPALPTKIVLDQ